jgi:hypothetical protein
LQNLEALNLTDTAVDDRGVPHLQAMPGLKRVWCFGSKVTAELPGAGLPN